MEQEIQLNEHNKQEYPPMHTAEHILNQTMVRMFGCPRSKNAHIERKKSKCDYELQEEPTAEMMEEVERRINEVIDRHLPVTIEFVPKAEAGKMISGDIVFIAGEMKVLIKSREISLTKTELKMLTFFLQNPKQILSKTQILENVFDLEGDFVDENTIAVNIRRLREKIEDNPAAPVYIKNIRGLGYIWNQEVRQ